MNLRNLSFLFLLLGLTAGIAACSIVNQGAARYATLALGLCIISGICFLSCALTAIAANK